MNIFDDKDFKWFEFTIFSCTNEMNKNEKRHKHIHTHLWNNETQRGTVICNTNEKVDRKKERDREPKAARSKTACIVAPFTWDVFFFKFNVLKLPVS